MACSTILVDGRNRRDDIANVHTFSPAKIPRLDRETESLARHIAGRQDRRDAR
jgi:hypothetical protein